MQLSSRADAAELLEHLRKYLEQSFELLYIFSLIVAHLKVEFMARRTLRQGVCAG